MACEQCVNKSYPPNEQGTPYIKCSTCGRELSEPAEKKRTLNQNRAIHLYLRLLADEMNKQGVTLQQVVKAIQRAEIRPTEHNLKEVVWREMQKALFGKESTTELTTAEVDKVYEMVNAFVTTKIDGYDGTSVPFPDANTKSLDELALQNN